MIACCNRATSNKNGFQLCKFLQRRIPACTLVGISYKFTGFLPHLFVHICFMSIYRYNFIPKTAPVDSADCPLMGTIGKFVLILPRYTLLSCHCLDRKSAV